jgi:hypothetical protein
VALATISGWETQPTTTLWSEIEKEFPTGNVFQAESPEYENRCRAYSAVLAALPAADGWSPKEEPLSLSDVNYQTISANEMGDVESHIALHDHLPALGRELREYRFRLNQQRRRLVRQIVAERIASIDAALLRLQKTIPKDPVGNEVVARHRLQRGGPRPLCPFAPRHRQRQMRYRKIRTSPKCRSGLGTQASSRRGSMIAARLSPRTEHYMDSFIVPRTWQAGKEALTFGLAATICA